MKEKIIRWLYEFCDFGWLSYTAVFTFFGILFFRVSLQAGFANLENTLEMNIFQENGLNEFFRVSYSIYFIIFSAVITLVKIFSEYERFGGVRICVYLLVWDAIMFLGLLQYHAPDYIFIGTFLFIGMVKFIIKCRNAWKARCKKKREVTEWIPKPEAEEKSEVDKTSATSGKEDLPYAKIGVGMSFDEKVKAVRTALEMESETSQKKEEESI